MMQQEAAQLRVRLLDSGVGPPREPQLSHRPVGTIESAGKSTRCRGR